MNIQFLIAVALYSANYHSGQASKLYSLGCIARHYLLKWYQIRSAEDWADAQYISEQYKAGMYKVYNHLVATEQGMG